MNNQIKQIEFVLYNPDWPRLYEIEAQSIKEALGNNCLEVHHVGSTSVPDLIAKPKIDIIAVVKDPEKGRISLEKIGFLYRGEYNIPLHHGFSKRNAVNVNLHVYGVDHPEVELNLLFRDYLRTHSNVRDEYAALKTKLAQDITSFEKRDSPFTNYTLRKGDFIRQVLKDAGFKCMRILKCNDATEWSTVRHFRQFYFFDKVPIADPYTWTFKHPNHAHLILYQGVEIIGYAHIQLWPENRAALRIIVITEAKRHQRFGGQFLTLIEKWLKAHGYKSFHMESSPEACSFYKKYGYGAMPSQDPDHYPGDPRDIPMGKVLT